ncbi:hypothetical protein BC008_35690 [Mastigocoleus testarum BC008]|uniref:Uncharacterized protein n=1 Tax=Mastigocoleus testarum BC008 TaxID=371196 RepID=A0A0V7ZY35_9CYAN|nr:hypothetical protein BC008_35690 [Mastigocoleus testarum BC008]
MHSERTGQSEDLSHVYYFFYLKLSLFCFKIHRVKNISIFTEQSKIRFQNLKPKIQVQQSKIQGMKVSI